MSHGGKGDKRRPLVVDEEQFNNNWDAIFGKVKIKLYGVEIEKTQEELDNLFKKNQECKHCFGIGYDASGQVCSCRDKK